MKPSTLNKKQTVDVLRVAAYVGASAALDFLISQTQGTQFGVFTGLINVVLVAVKQVFTAK